MTIRHTSHARNDLWYHLAWSTKYRKVIFTNPETRTEVAALLREVAGYFVRSAGPGLTKKDVEHYITEQAAES